MKRVLLTGATGFVGRHCLQPLLERGYEVHALTSRPVPTTEQDGVHWHLLDLLAPRPLSLEQIQPTHLLHLAWYAVPGKYWTSPENVRWVEASLALLRASGVVPKKNGSWRRPPNAESNPPCPP